MVPSQGERWTTCRNRAPPYAVTAPGSGAQPALSVVEGRFQTGSAVGIPRTAPPSENEHEEDSMSSTPGTPATDETSDLIASDKVEGTAVYNAAGDRLGTVHNFMVGKRSGKVA